MRRFGAPILGILLAAVSWGGSASACGFEDPSSIGFQRGILNLAFPKSLHITSALWRAESAGLIPNTRNTLMERGHFGYRNAFLRLNRMGRNLTGASSETEQSLPAFSVILVGSMLWTRFELVEGEMVVRPHQDGPGKGDVVIVTDSVVVGALTDGSLDFETAEAAGLLRFYGLADDIAALTARMASPGYLHAAVVRD
jgi:hypothetical protein